MLYDHKACTHSYWLEQAQADVTVEKTALLCWLDVEAYNNYLKAKGERQY